ncbi:antitoxin [Ornithinimicrobium ciconiae]|uniref:Antitoxin n=1 Tax=Ornithinimicrobium ciconiae TaxID=2594265 RepID=A0A516GDF4_9MICO|nr:type II toxin-antitoxin system VapB family antitoxin [Ornithinimicrobium ciconiae]QDO89555.1 antitoxin [Ornithinimicrobium ciconiae]
MSLNIKNATTHQLVRELAEATGLTQTAAVEDAVRRRLSEVRNERGLSPAQLKRLDHSRQLAADFRRDLTDEDRERIRTADDWLYDDRGPHE